ncbi:rod shape-determining protein MreD [Liquorilactobacillus mali]|uniref:Rod shape-determining protein MreD n=1 Tax=Liquorilactobacillus mali KCTC 3596 = DSM 20444 TaxID=1046596 RepID=J0L8E5_9LACO|nr:rod shape-determining protein MreD [Liquorilactobacillus mali]EJF02163.1 rod shape-determining protein [Liquorilactobacillus mali KCTC 3596 = DSM 20444]KRN10231.1 rod shape-determining protein MreD [Liquorilactobacillus mali KCTC 3596 = DSM 20444]MDC7952766.1 rod shape-determining protein MreD [Liquorilactobacillus mali]MDV7757946.1 rod shape-determining protein MreD [Liquorilactobacillus mali]QFQ74502.1 rod shape-determining protein MreD [Liquorilactobacillus mali]
MRVSKIRYYYPLGLFIALFLDGTLSNIFAGNFFTANVSIESRLFLLWVVMSVFFAKVEHPFFWAIAVGLTFDLFFTGIIGPFFMLVPFILYLTRVMYSFFTPSFIVVLLIYLIDIALFTLLFYWINVLIGFTSVSLAGFISGTLGPTLAFNLAVFVILYLPIKGLMEMSSR